jgi:tetratricopeptide (TPR) repeat protein
LVLAALALGLAAFHPLRQRVRAASSGDGFAVVPRRSVAALEFANLSRSPEVAWLAMALPEMLAAELAASGEIRTLPGEIVARAESDDASGAPVPGPQRLRRIGTQLGVDYLLAGSYLVVGHGAERRVRVDFRLHHAASGETVVALNDTRDEASLLALVTDAGTRLRKSLGLGPLTAAETRAWLAAVPADPEARSLYFEGLRKLRSVDAQGARELLERAIEREAEFPLAHAALASAWITLGYDVRAQEAAQAALERSSSLSREGRLLVEANYHRTARQWNEAIQRLQALFTFYPDEIEYGLRLASTLSFAGRGQEALQVVARLAALPQPMAGDPRIDLAEADAANSLGEHKHAAAAASAAIAKGRRAGTRRLLAGALAYKGSALTYLGELAGAKAALEEALALSRALGDRFEEARDVHSLGHVVRLQGDPSRAEAMYRRALEISEEVGNRRGASTALNSLSNLLLERGEVTRALKSYEDVLSIKREVGDRRGEGIVLYNMGHAHYALGEIAAAERRFLEGLAVRRQVGERIGIANSLHGLAMIRLISGNLKSIPELLREAETISREVGDQEFLASTFAFRGDLLLLQGKLAEALASHQEALRIRRRVGLETQIPESLSSIAEILLERGRFGEAAALAKKAAEGYRRVEHADGEAMARVTVVVALAAQGRLAEAERDLAPLLAAEASGQRLERHLQVILAAVEVDAAADRRRIGETRLASALEKAESAGFLPYVLDLRLA